MTDAKTPQDSGTPHKGGFGAFSQQYRERWAEKHPDGKQPATTGTATPTPPVDAADGAGAASDTDTQA